VNVLLWHQHGSWTNAFVRGAHRVLLPVLPGRPPAGRGRARTWEWPSSAAEVTPEQLADTEVDVVVVQQPEQEELARRWLGGRRPGRDLPLVWLEHNTPPAPCRDNRHPAADRDDVTIVHVTPTNALLWDCGRTRTAVIEHGVVDPGHRFRGDLAAAAAVINEPVRRGRAVGTDLLPRFGREAPLHVYGIDVDRLPAAPGVLPVEDVPQAVLHEELARHRAYVHPYRWTSLGLALIEAMLLGLPVVALATTEVPDAVPAGAGIVSNHLDRLAAGLRQLVHDPAAAEAAGRVGRAAALERFGLSRFLDDWTLLLKDVTA
jgi:glycosyltransferase involved in cell wall biosynthesis